MAGDHVALCGSEADEFEAAAGEGGVTDDGDGVERAGGEFEVDLDGFADAEGVLHDGGEASLAEIEGDAARGGNATGQEVTKGEGNAAQRAEVLAGTALVMVPGFGLIGAKVHDITGGEATRRRGWIGSRAKESHGWCGLERDDPAHGF